MERFVPTVTVEERELRCVVHGDDFTFLGPEEELEWVAEKMKGWCEIKMRGVLGPEKGDMKSIDILSRLVSSTDEGITYEADPKHAKGLLEEFELGVESTSLECPGIKETEKVK